MLTISHKGLLSALQNASIAGGSMLHTTTLTDWLEVRII